MAQIIIPQYISGTDTGTLSGIARQYKTDILTLQKLNPQITDIDKIQAGATLNVPDVKKTDVSSSQIIGSSDLARNQFDKDLETLPKKESEFAAPLPETGEVKTEQPVIKPEITLKSSNPAYQSLIDQTNETLRQFKEQGGTLSPENQDRLNQINNFQAQKTMAIANAREAADAKDATKLNEELTKANEADKASKTAVDTLRENLKTARETYISALKPTEAETELKRKLNTLRTERQLLPLELRKEGISAAGIAGRQVEDERVRAIQEGNLLTELGLEQEARQFATAVKEKQLDWITKDIELQQKIDDKIKEDARNVLEDARELKKDSLSVLSTILDDQKGFGGLAWTDLDSQSQVDLMEMIKPYPDLTISLVSKALGNIKQQKIFERALKTAKQEKPTTKETETIEITQIDNKLSASKGADGFVDPQVFLKERQKSIISPDEFNKRFGYLLSPQEKKNLGIEKGGRMTASTLEEQTMTDLLSDIKQGATLQQLYSAYSEVSPSLIQSLYYNQ